MHARCRARTRAGWAPRRTGSRASGAPRGRPAPGPLGRRDRRPGRGLQRPARGARRAAPRQRGVCRGSRPRAEEPGRGGAGVRRGDGRGRRARRGAGAPIRFVLLPPDTGYYDAKNLGFDATTADVVVFGDALGDGCQPAVRPESSVGLPQTSIPRPGDSGPALQGRRSDIERETESAGVMDMRAGNRRQPMLRTSPKVMVRATLPSSS